MIDVVTTLWPLALAAVAYVVWLIRLEAKVLQQHKDLTRLERRMDEDRDDVKQVRAEQMGIMQEMQRDIKILLGRGHVQHWSDPTIPPISNGHYRR